MKTISFITATKNRTYIVPVDKIQYLFLANDVGTGIVMLTDGTQLAVEESVFRDIQKQLIQIGRC